MNKVNHQPKKCLIVNGDDFGLNSGINRGILHCHLNGILTSASLMVAGEAAQEAAAMSRDHPTLSVGLHWDVDGKDGGEFNINDGRLVRDEFCRQLDAFYELMGCLPTHVDSHHHTHRREVPLRVLKKIVGGLDVPLRGDGQVHFVSAGFFAWRESRLMRMEGIAVFCLQSMLRDEVSGAWTEFAFHPGYVTDSAVTSSTYTLPGEERRSEAEIQLLTDLRVKRSIQELGIRLANFSDYYTAAISNPALRRKPDADWRGRIELLTTDLETIAPPAGRIIFVDEDQLRSRISSDYQVLPFLEKEGQYWGPPADDLNAIDEFERLRRTGAGLIVFAWPAFWWLDHYAVFHNYLQRNFRRVARTDRLIAFDLRLPPDNSNSQAA